MKKQDNKKTDIQIMSIRPNYVDVSTLMAITEIHQDIINFTQETFDT